MLLFEIMSWLMDKMSRDPFVYKDREKNAIQLRSTSVNDVKLIASVR